MARQTSRSTHVRRPGAAALAVAATFGLFYVMQVLSTIHAVGIVDPPHYIGIDIGTMPEDSPVETRVRPPVRQEMEPAPPSSSRIAHTSFSGQEPDRAGSVENARVIDSEPPRVFDRAALKAASRCRFLPQKVDGQPVATFDVPLVFSFDPSEQEEIR